MSFLKGFTNWVKGWRLDKFFKGFVNGDEQAAAELTKTVEMSNDFVSRVLGYLQSPVGDIVSVVIPGDWDDKLREQGIQVLLKVNHNMAPFMGCVALPTLGEQLACIYEKIEALGDEDEVDSFKHKLAIFATKAFADGKLTFSDAILAAQFVFELVTKKKK